MAFFEDFQGKKHRVELDAFTLDDVRKLTGVDLGAMSAEGWLAISNNDVDLVKVLAAICSPESTREFGRQLRGDSIESARAALLEAAVDFFPMSSWSEIQSNLARRKAIGGAMSLGPLSEIQGLANVFANLPADIQAKLLEEEKGEAGDSNLQRLQELASAIGQGVTPSSVVTDSPVSADVQPAG